jgi:hypothetical protein
MAPSIRAFQGISEDFISLPKILQHRERILTPGPQESDRKPGGKETGSTNQWEN